MRSVPFCLGGLGPERRGSGEVHQPFHWNGGSRPYLLRFEVGETTWFRTFDLQQEHGEIDLMAGAAQAVDPMTGKEGTQDE